MRDLILVVDDKPVRRPTYENFAAACKDPVTLPSFEIELMFADSQYHVERLLRQHSFSAIILDIVLTDWDYDAEKILLKVEDDKIPIILVSSDWDSKDVRELVANFPKKNIRMFIHWNDLKDQKHIQARGFNFTLAKYIEDYKKIDYSLRLESDSPVRILHLSDLQFGGYENWKQNFTSVTVPVLSKNTGMKDRHLSLSPGILHSADSLKNMKQHYSGFPTSSLIFPGLFPLIASIWFQAITIFVSLWHPALYSLYKQKKTPSN